MSNSVTPRRGQERFIADTDETGLGAVDAVADESAPTSVWSEAWRYLRRRPLFWIAATLIFIALLLALVPQWFTSVKPDACVLQESLRGPGPGHPFGFNRQGCDIGGFLDSVLSRITDIFFAIPLVLAAIVVMQMFKEQRTIVTVVLVLGIFGWTSIARITRGAVMSVKNDEYVTAAKALGASKSRILLQHILPNAAAPIIVYSLPACCARASKTRCHTPLWLQRLWLRCATRKSAKRAGRSRQGIPAR